MERTLILMGVCLFIGAQSAPTTQLPVEDITVVTETISVPDLGYLAVAPKVLISGTTESVCIHLLQYDPEEPIELSVVLLMSDNATQLSNAPLYIMETQQDCVKIQVPDVEEYSTEAILRVQAKRLFAPQVDFEVVNDKKVHIKKFGSDTFIQTDKPIYKPGQTVYFRIMTLDQELKPDTSAFSEIWIEAPSGTRLAQWQDEQSDDGLIDLKMPMTPDPLMGEWKIVAIQNGQKTEQTFEVDEYVLPKFEVIVTTPSFVLVDVEEFDVEICGRYTYGQPVEGSFSGTISVKTDGYEYSPRPIVQIENQDTGQSGCGRVTVNASDLNLKSTEHSLWNAHINVNVDFTEANTDFVVSESTKGGKVTSDPLKLAIHAPGTFKPGVPFFGQITVKHPDDSVASNEFIRMTARTNDGEIMEQNYTSPANGIIEFEVPDIDINANRLELYAWAPGYDSGKYEYREYTIYDPATTFNAKPRFSPSGSFIQMSPIRGEVEADSEQMVDIYYTSDLAEDVDELFTFIFMARGNIIDVPVSEPSAQRRRREVNDQPGPLDGTERAGQCPPLDTIDSAAECGTTCTNDLDCEANKKCCDAGCEGGGKACVALIFIDPPGPVKIKIHKGDCPAVNDTMGTCDFLCEHDGNCAPDEKCCSNGCGTDCTTAVIDQVNQPGPLDGTERVGQCPPLETIDAVKCGKSCTSDLDCAANKKCCDAGCEDGGKSCVPLIIVDPPGPVKIKIHKGDCPAVNDTVGTCNFLCEHDGNCSPDEKCCSNGCGTQCAPSVRACPEVCAFIYSPVCGTDGNTYPSECDLDAAACRDNTPDLRIAYRGECVPGTTAPPIGTAEPLTMCQLQQQEAGPLIPGRYIPQCTETGEYVARQCHGSTGYCWCVNENGEELVGTKIRGQPECEQCPTSCIEIYAPVCGTDGQTYSNDCKLKKAACDNRLVIEVDYSGECRECPEFCTRDYTPVCGTDDQTYSNACELERVACTEGNQLLTVAYEGECGQDVTTTADPMDHSGECPPVDEGEAMVGVCANLCSVDTECNTTQRCCPTFCGGFACMDTMLVDPPETLCPLCPLLFAPVCGSDGETYSSSCELRHKACVEDLLDLYVDYSGECQPDVEIAEPGELRKIQRRFRVTADMSPIVRVLAYYIRPDGEVIADAMSFKVKPTFENQVEIEFEDKEAKPAGTTRLRVSAAPNSLCALGIVDKSVHLLGGDNSITKNKVFSALTKYQLSDTDGQIEPSTHCPIVYPWWWRGGDFKRRRRYAIIPTLGVEYDDASLAFQDMGLVFLSNLDVETRPCPEGRDEIYYRGVPGPIPQAVPIALANEQVIEDVFEDNSQGATVQLRNYFPETWLWSLERTGPSGEATVDLDVPHTITEWVSNGFCTSFEAGVGVSETSLLKAFQPFFVSLTLPYSVIRGESVPIKATIFNYLEECLVIEATFTEDARIPLVDTAQRVQQVCVCGGDSEPITFQVVPGDLGNIPVRVDAVSVADTGLLCGNEAVASGVTAADAIEKELLVEAEGVEQEISYSNYVCPSDYFLNTYNERLPLILPPDYVEGSEKAKVQVTGDIMGPTLSNIENLVQRPYGCGEQNMLGFVPNIFVMKYLTSTDQLTPEIETRTKNNMQIGYQRELNYRRRDGSYSAFGENDPEGSTWLTAFVLWSFAQASNYIAIDQKDLTVSAAWLKQQQDPGTGCFNAVGQVHHKAMKGGVNNGVTLTAYVLMAMLEGGIPPEDEAVTKALECLHNSVDTLSDTYTAAQMAYALALAGSDRLDDVMGTLESLATEKDGFKFWESNRDDIAKDYSYGYQAPLQSQNIEMTAYALLAYIVKLERQALSEGNEIARWIIQQRNPNGGFSSTQDTIVALQALSEYSKLAYQGGISMLLDVKVRRPFGVPNRQVHVTDVNRLLQQEVEVPVPSALVLRGRGRGCALVQVAIKYNIIPEPPKQAPFNLKTAVMDISNPAKHEPCYLYNIHMCTSYSGPDGESNMALVQVKLVSGFYPEKASLIALESAGIESFRKAEFEKKTVTIYFDKLTDEQICFSINVFRDIDVDDPKPGVISVTDYYEKDMTVSEMYELDCATDFPEDPQGRVGPTGPLPVDGEENRVPVKVEVTKEPKVEEPVKVDPTEPAKEEPTEPAKEEPTEPAKEVPTEPAKEEPTEPAKEEPTEPAKEEPTEPAKEEPAKIEPTEPPKKEPTEPPKEEPTEPPKEKPTGPAKEEPIEPATEVATEPEATKVSTVGPVATEPEAIEVPTVAPVCMQYCTSIYDPVCGSDGNTYGNECELENAKCENAAIKLISRGACSDTTEPTKVPCPDLCLLDYEPVCASNGKTYTNRCDLQIAQCTDSTIKFVLEGECVVTEEPTKPSCLRACALIYAPVCGSDGKTHPNECAMDNEACEKQTVITVEYVGECTDTVVTKAPCPEVCTTEYDPVCGSNGKIYSNRCELEIAQCNDETLELASEGECVVTEEPTKPSCLRACTFIYDPVCGSDGQTYSNECVMETAACEKETVITVAYNGACKGTVTEGPCPEVCTAEYAPVCGSNGKSYSNKCELEIAQCKDETLELASEGECVATEETTKPSCLQACALIYAPVCGSDLKTHPNECAMENEACEKGTVITVAYVGECTDTVITEAPCPEVCTAEYAPVCGSNGKTYSNRCELEIAQCNDETLELASEGECVVTEEPTKPSCSQACALIYDPVCGSDGKTYPNECVMETVACKKDTVITVAYVGECTDTVVTAAPCPEVCTTEYDPVCGSNGKTYSNRCELEIAQCNDKTLKLASEGECVVTEEPTKVPCPDLCLLDYEPVCASDGKTYTNRCDLQIVQCTDSSIKFVSEGECPVTEEPTKPSCLQVCATIFDPVCGSDGKTYSNRCTMENEACEKDIDITVAYVGLCTDTVVTEAPCPEICTEEYAPVCGSNGKTYSNRCELEKVQCADDSLQLEYEGECTTTEPPPKPDCAQICPALFDPVCGSDGQTYSNDCNMEVAACEANTEITVAYVGECIPDGGPGPVPQGAGVCDSDPNICGDNGVCINTDGGYTCDCVDGYEFTDQGLCEDQDECSMSVDICGANSNCINLAGTYSCECLEGYERDTETDTCVDTDECQNDVFICGDYGSCTNIPGSYECSCIEGYTRTQDGCVVSCPVCANDLPSGWETDYCAADFVYVTKVRNDGQFRLLRSMSVADGDIAVTDRRYVKPEWDAKCLCDNIQGGARLTVIGYSKNRRDEVSNGKNVEVLFLDSNSYIVPTTVAKDSIEKVQPNC